MYSRGDALKYPLHCCHQVSQFAPVSGLRSTPSIAARHRRAGSARRRRLWHDVGAERRALAGRVQLDAVDCGATSAQSVVRRRASSARRRRWRRDMGAVRQRAISARRSRWRRDIGAERRAPASGLSSTLSMVARRRRGAPFAGERAQLDAVDCGATTVRSAPSRRAGTCLTPSIAARRRRRAPCAGGGEAQLDAVDCGATSAPSAVRRRAGSARRLTVERHRCGAPQAGELAHA